MGIPSGVAAQKMPSSDLLVPYFEVDLGGFARTTVFEITNWMDAPVEVELTVHTNWGIPVLEPRRRLAAGETASFNLRDWLLLGQPPGQRLTASELAHLRAALTGRRSPRDGMYYSSEVTADRAVGYVTVRTLGGRPDALWGNFFTVDPLEDYAQGDVLADIDPSSAHRDLCRQHAVFFLEGGDFGGSTELLIWTGQRGKPAATPEISTSARLEVGVKDPRGTLLGDGFFTLRAVESLAVADLPLAGAPVGSLELTALTPSEQPLETYVALRYSAEGRYSAGLTSWCLPPAPASSDGPPRIRIEKSTNGEDADEPPGPAIPAGEPVLWEYVVTNLGPVELYDVTVSDDRGEMVVCPQVTLAPEESMTCTARGVAREGQYVNVGTAAGQAPGSEWVVDTDRSHYHGAAAARW